jgi:predicted transcriptional regulator
LDEDVEKVRSPNFSMWLCTQKRIHKFRWKDMASHLGVSCQGVHSYANGTSHPQIMNFYGICEFIALHTKQPINNIIIKGMMEINKDRKL